MSKSKPATTTTNSQTSIPDWLSSAAQSVAGNAASLPGYTPYTGEGAAGLSGNQQTAIDYVRGLLGNGSNIINAGVHGATGAANFSAPQITTGGVNTDTAGLLSPYTHQVVDASNNEIDRQRAIQQTRNDASAGAAHVFSGDRAGVVQAANDRDYNTLKANNTATLLDKGYGDARTAALGINSANQNAAINSAGVNVMGSQALTGAGAGVTGANTADVNGLLTTGGVAQQTQQTKDTFDVSQYMAAYNSLLQRLQAQSGALGALPHGSTTNSTEQKMTYSNALGPALGLGLGIASLGMGGGATLGGSLISGLLGSGGSATA